MNASSSLTVFSTTTIELVSGSFEEFSDLAFSIRMRLFGHLVRLAAPILDFDNGYPGDLFVDAQFVEAVSGPTSFLYYVRPMGTNYGDTALAMASIDKTGCLYAISLHHDRMAWSITVSELAV